MAKKYSKGAENKIEKVMHELKEGTLRSGSGKKVTSRKQAIAIGISEARESGEKVPAKKSAKKNATKKSTTKSAAKKSTKKSAVKKATKKSAAKKSTTKRVAKK